MVVGGVKKRKMKKYFKIYIHLHDYSGYGFEKEKSLRIISIFTLFWPLIETLWTGILMFIVSTFSKVQFFPVYYGVKLHIEI